jgi:hypothetical protein
MIESPEVVTLSLPVEMDTDYERYFTLGKVAKYVGSTEDICRNLLLKEKLIVQSNGFWRLTHAGEQFGKMFQTQPEWPHKTYTRAHIRYNPAAVALLKTLLKDRQAALLA